MHCCCIALTLSNQGKPRERKGKVQLIPKPQLQREDVVLLSDNVVLSGVPEISPS